MVPAGSALPASPTGDYLLGDDSRANRYAMLCICVFSDRNDAADKLMAWYDGWLYVPRTRRIAPEQGRSAKALYVRSTDSTRFDLDQHLCGTRLRHWHLLEAIVSGTVATHGTHSLWYG